MPLVRDSTDFTLYFLFWTIDWKHTQLLTDNHKERCVCLTSCSWDFKLNSAEPSANTKRGITILVLSESWIPWLYSRFYAARTKHSSALMKSQNPWMTWVLRVRYALCFWYTSFIYCSARRAGIWVTAECWFCSSTSTNNDKNYIAYRGNYMCVYKATRIPSLFSSN